MTHHRGASEPQILLFPQAFIYIAVIKVEL